MVVLLVLLVLLLRLLLLRGVYIWLRIAVSQQLLGVLVIYYVNMIEDGPQINPGNK